MKTYPYLATARCLVGVGAEKIREIQTEASDTIHVWSKNGKVLLVQDWKDAGVMCYGAINHQNSMDAELKAIEVYFL